MSVWPILGALAIVLLLIGMTVLALTCIAAGAKADRADEDREKQIHRDLANDPWPAAVMNSPLHPSPLADEVQRNHG